MEPLVIAHRGANKIAPENTLSAFKKALETGADGIETDVQLTKDGKMVMHHNYTIDANSNGNGRIDSHTLEELRQFDFGIVKGEEFRGEKIPTLDEVLEISKDFKVINIELKAPMDRNIPYVKMVADAVVKSGLMDKIIISAFDHSLLNEMKKYNSEIKVGVLISGELPRRLLEFLPKEKIIDEITIEDIKMLKDISESNVLAIWRTVCAKSAIFSGLTIGETIKELEKQEDILNYTKKLDFNIDYVHPAFEICFKNKDLVKEMHKKGIGVIVWPPSSEEDLKELLKYNLDGIITNSPEILIKIKNKTVTGT